MKLPNRSYNTTEFGMNVTPYGIRDMLFPIYAALKNGYLSIDNFKVIGINNEPASEFIKTIVDLPSRGKLFEGQWIDTSVPNTVAQTATRPVRCNGYGELFVIDNLVSISLANDTYNSSLLYWGITLSGGNIIFKIYGYNPATGLFVKKAETGNIVLGANGIANTAPSSISGVVNFSAVTLGEVPVTRSNFIDCSILLNSDRVPYSNSGNDLYSAVGKLCNKISDGTDVVRNNSVSISITKEGMKSTGNVDNAWEKTGYAEAKYESQREPHYGEGNTSQRLGQEESPATVTEINTAVYNAVSYQTLKIPKPFGYWLKDYSVNGGIRSKFNLGIQFDIYPILEDGDSITFRLDAILDPRIEFEVEDFITFSGNIELLYTQAG